MKTAAIIAEYNPFHNGHKLQIDTLRSGYGVTHVAAVMSGAFTQRGGPAIFDKFIRAKAALACGVDLVIQLPYYYSGQTAEIFASGGAGIVDMLGIGCISFGCEDCDVELYNEISDILNDEPAFFTSRLKAHLQDGLSYAAARQKSLESILRKELGLLKKPNNILALEYIRSLRKRGSKVNLAPVLRGGAGHDCERIQTDICSAKYIREQTFGGCAREIFSCLPNVYKSPEEYDAIPRHNADDYRWILKAHLLLTDPASLAVTAECEGGLENRLLKNIGALDNGVERFIDAVCTKRYAKARIRRILFNSLFGYTKADLAQAKNYVPSYVRILAANKKGREILNSFPGSIQVIANISKQAGTLNMQDKKILGLDLRVENLFHLYTGKSGSDAAAKPVITE